MNVEQKIRELQIIFGEIHLCLECVNQVLLTTQMCPICKSANVSPNSICSIIPIVF